MSKLNLSDKFSTILRENGGYIKKLEYKPKEFWNSQIVKKTIYNIDGGPSY